MRFLPDYEEKIAAFLQTMKFRRKIFGGVDEKDAQRKIEALNELYQEALLAERARCDALLAERGDAR
jgi:hypothetical protein